jgi:glucokinase
MPSTSEDILTAGVEGDKIWEKILNMFVKNYVTEIGDFALKINPTGGLFIVENMAFGNSDYLASPKSEFRTKVEAPLSLQRFQFT